MLTESATLPGARCTVLPPDVTLGLRPALAYEILAEVMSQFVKALVTDSHALLNLGVTTCAPSQVRLPVFNK